MRTTGRLVAAGPMARVPGWVTPVITMLALRRARRKRRRDTLIRSGVLLRIASALVVAARAWRAVTIAQRTRRVVRRAGVIALGGLLVWVLAGLPFFVFPAVDPVPKRADVLLVLGPPVPDRVAVAERLLDAGTVGAALVSVPYDTIPPEIASLCARPNVTCADPDPRTTRGEARMLRRYAKERGWTSAVVTTMPAHIARARSIVGRCFGGTLSMVPDAEGPSGGWPYQYAYQTAATVKSWFLPGC